MAVTRAEITDTSTRFETIDQTKVDAAILKLVDWLLSEPAPSNDGAEPDKRKRDYDELNAVQRDV